MPVRNFVLDTSAVLALRSDEPGAERVQTLLKAPEFEPFKDILQEVLR